MSGLVGGQRHPAGDWLQNFDVPRLKLRKAKSSGDGKRSGIPIPRRSRKVDFPFTEDGK